jgi:hypothetical protein
LEPKGNRLIEMETIAWGRAEGYGARVARHRVNHIQKGLYNTHNELGLARLIIEELMPGVSSTGYIYYSPW